MSDTMRDWLLGAVSVGLLILATLYHHERTARIDAQARHAATVDRAFGQARQDAQDARQRFQQQRKIGARALHRQKATKEHTTK